MGSYGGRTALNNEAVVDELPKCACEASADSVSGFTRV
jgi:hypothetical protein